MLASASTMSAVQGPVDIDTERTTSVARVSPGSEIVESVVSTDQPPVDTESFSSCVLAPSAMFTGVISPSASAPCFLAGSLHIHLEMEESSKSECAAKCLAYSIERLTVNQITKLPIESLMMDVVELEREMTYPLPANADVLPHSSQYCSENRVQALKRLISPLAPNWGFRMDDGIVVAPCMSFVVIDLSIALLSNTPKDQPRSYATVCLRYMRLRAL
jgi:hypothetical protein